jgi:hypothetical protein
MGKYYYCYSIKLKDFLKTQGLAYITKCLHHKTHKPFFMFERCVLLDEKLNMWSKFKEEENLK